MEISVRELRAHKTRIGGRSVCLPEFHTPDGVMEIHVTAKLWNRIQEMDEDQVFEYILEPIRTKSGLSQYPRTIWMSAKIYSRW